MIQRHQKRRQAGFIRTNDISRIDSIQRYRENITFQSQKSLQFSPFKDQSPTPLEKIIKTYRKKTNSHFQELVSQFKQNIQHSNTPLVQDSRQPKRKEKKHHYYHNYSREERIQEQIDKPALYFQFEPSYFTQQIKNDKKKRYERFEKIQQAKKSKAIITQTIQEIHVIQNKPQVLNLSLAEAFNLNCHKLKQKLERQRIKFSSRSKVQKRRKNQYGSTQSSQISKNRASHAYSSKNIDNFYECKSKNVDQYLKMKNRNSDNQEKRRTMKKEQNKENCQENSNMNSKRQLKTARPSIDMNSTKFFIPISSSRSKPITPKQAYQHSLKKWKQLPEVVAREKERERESQLRQRLSKMKAHSIEVRNKLKR